MNNDPIDNKTGNPPSEETLSAKLPSEETFTDPGSGNDESFGYQDWNNPDDRYEMIAEAAYYKAEQRGFEIGNDELDWLEAEQELLEQLGLDPVY